MADAWGGSWGASWGLSWTPADPTPPDVGGRIVGGQFSRGKWRELRRKKWEELQAAIRAVEAKAEETKRAKERKALRRAAEDAKSAVDDIEADYQAQQLADMLQSAADAKTMAGVINAARIVSEYAMAMADDEDDIEILMLAL